MLGCLAPLFFNKKEEVSETIELFKKNQNRFFSLLKDEEKLFFIVFKKEKVFKRRLLLDHFHYCMNLFEDFVVYNLSQNNKEKRLELLEQFYAEKRIEKEFLAINKKRTKIEEAKKISIESNLKLYLLHKNKYEYLIKDFDNEIFKEIDTAVDYLDKYYFFSKMNIFKELSANTLMNNVEYTHVFKDEIFEVILDKASTDDDFLYKIYLYTIQLYSKDFDSKRYKALKKLVFENLENCDVKLKRKLLSDLSNYVSYMYNKDANNSLIQESFEIIKMQIEHKTMIENNTFNESSFAQDIRVAVYLKEYDWAESFIETHKKYLKNKDLIIFSRAELFYAQEKYDELYDSIEKISQSKKLENYNIKCVYAKALFDQRRYDELSNHLINFSKTLHRQKENSEKLLSSKNGFILYFKKVVKKYIQ